MSHVNEGQIHAYLDRQLEFADQAARERFETHVAECSDCTVLLEEARAIHARATGML
ncbi:MAG: zf-HC2 domain-containing protein, partial [Gemmatimonadetes bacterium]|nr:zf-HC2 domain-containing protein [Gemmatimonadota bacterium]